MSEPGQLVDAASGTIIIPRLYFAKTFWQRLRGLQFRRPLAIDEGLLIAPCRSIHTHWMRFAIDVIMLASDGMVLAVHQTVPPWRIVRGPKNTRGIVETVANSAARPVEPGTRVTLIHPVSGPAKLF